MSLKYESVDELELEPGWLERQIKATQEEVATWPKEWTGEKLSEIDKDLVQKKNRYRKGLRT